MIYHTTFVHSLTRIRLRRTYGWFSPAELPGDSPQDVSFVLPVDSRRRFNPSYVMEIFRYSANGLQSKDSTAIRHVYENVFRTRINNIIIEFREKRHGLRNRAFKYMGEFQHKDFQFKMVEIEPESMQLIDRLYLKFGIVLIGCDPSAHYQGWSDLAPGIPQVTDYPIL
jgi:hypothetical protein